eukprot:2857743-Rhodomonas_salina.1
MSCWTDQPAAKTRENPMQSTTAMSASQDPPRPGSIASCCTVCWRVKELDVRGYPLDTGSTVLACCGHHFCSKYLRVERCSQTASPFTIRHNICDRKEPFTTECGCDQRMLPGVLGECKALAHLDFHNWIDAEGARRLAEVLGECKTLAHLDLSNNEIGGERAGRLAGVLGEWKTLVHLDLSHNMIGDGGAGKLGEVLGECKALAHLALSSNGIGAEGAARLARVLGECKAVAHFDLSENEIGAEGAGRLAR